LRLFLEVNFFQRKTVFAINEDTLTHNNRDHRSNGENTLPAMTKAAYTNNKAMMGNHPQRPPPAMALKPAFESAFVF
jgi:hypothetical protein